MNGYIKDDFLNKELIGKFNKHSNLTILTDCCHSGTTCMDLQNVYDNNDTIKLSEEKRKINMISGCRDSQTSLDVHTNKGFQGALTQAFLTCVNSKDINLFDSSELEWRKFHENIHNQIKQKNFQQRPVYSNSNY